MIVCASLCTPHLTLCFSTKDIFIDEEILLLHSLFWNDLQLVAFAMFSVFIEWF